MDKAGCRVQSEASQSQLTVALETTTTHYTMTTTELSVDTETSTTVANGWVEAGAYHTAYWSGNGPDGVRGCPAGRSNQSVGAAIADLVRRTNEESGTAFSASDVVVRTHRGPLPPAPAPPPAAPSHCCTTVSTTTVVDLNIGLAIGADPAGLTLARVNHELGLVGLAPLTHRLAVSATEATYVVRCEDQLGGVNQAARIFTLAARLSQDAIAAVPHHGAPALCVGPAAHLWGGCFLPQHWISLV